MFLVIFSRVLVIIGALNWGLIGIFNFDLVKFIVFHNMVVAHIIYTLVGIAGVYALFTISTNVIKNCPTKKQTHHTKS